MFLLFPSIFRLRHNKLVLCGLLMLFLTPTKQAYRRDCVSLDSFHTGKVVISWILFGTSLAQPQQHLRDLTEGKISCETQTSLKGRLVIKVLSTGG